MQPSTSPSAKDTAPPCEHVSLIANTLAVGEDNGDRDAVNLSLPWLGIDEVGKLADVDIVCDGVHVPVALSNSVSSAVESRSVTNGTPMAVAQLGEEAVNDQASGLKFGDPRDIR